MERWVIAESTLMTQSIETHAEMRLMTRTLK